MKELFKTQLEKSKPITKEDILKLNNKNYYNGDEINVGDSILLALLVGEPNYENNELPMKPIMLKEEHFNYFYYEERMNKRRTDGIPMIKLK